MIEGLFPCPIGEYKLDRALNQNEMGYLKNITMETNTGNTVSATGDILHNDKMIELTKFIGDSIDEYCAETYDFDTNKIQIYITQSWTNRTKPGEYHHVHSHQNSIISGVFYFEGNDDDAIEFWNPRNWLGSQHWAIESKSNNFWNSHTWWYPANTGSLLLFPSLLEHSVPEVKGKNERFSLSFNTFFKGTLGDSRERTELIL